MPEEIKADITGTVWKILVEVGDEVVEEDELMILESMKMEIPVEAPVDGTITKICVAEGEAIDDGKVLLTFEES